MILLLDSQSKYILVSGILLEPNHITYLEKRIGHVYPMCDHEILIHLIELIERSNHIVYYIKVKRNTTREMNEHKI